MKNIFSWPILILCIALTCATVYAVNGSDPHAFNKNQCGFCHVNFDAPLRFRDNINTLCNFCHKNDRALSHVVGIKPSMPVPEDLHLDENGELTCATCHHVHMKRNDPATSKRTYLLRRNVAGRQFCNACHVIDAEFIGEKKKSSSSHSDIMDTAHFGYYTGEYYAIDRVSLTCIGCHEGANGSSVQVITKQTHSIGDSHRIGMNYTKTQRKKSGLFRSPRAIDPEIKMFGGKIGCTSCHNPFKLSKHRLSVDNEESKLCLECHIK